VNGEPLLNWYKEKVGICSNIVAEVGSDIGEIYGNRSLPCPECFVWDESPEELKNLVESFTGHDVSTDAEGSVVTWKQDGQLVAVIRFSDMLLNQMSRSTPLSRLNGADTERYVTIIEEVSHFMYCHSYFQMYGEIPEPAMVELIAVLDQYNVFQAQSIRNLGRLADQRVNRILFEDQAGAYSNDFLGITPGRYVIGHRLGVKYLTYLNRLHNGGGDADTELSNFYHMTNTEQLGHLLYTLKLDFDTFSEKEEKEMLTICQELNVPVYRR